MFHTYQASANVMIILACRRILSGRVCSVSAVTVSMLPATPWQPENHSAWISHQPQRWWQWMSMVHCPSLYLCLLARFGKGSFVITSNISGCHRWGDKADPQFVKKNRESQQRCGELRGWEILHEASGSSVGAGMLEAAAANGGTWFGNTGK